jgi:membrane-anchored glycerophosphoryl diester phosphodiesterase (GDPDase)
MAPEVSSPVVDLRPLTTGELIDRGFLLYRRNFAGLLLLALLSQAPFLLAQAATNSLHLVPPANEMFNAPAALAGGWIFISIMGAAAVISFLFLVVMTFYVSDGYLGKIPSLAQSFRRFGGCVARSIWTCLLNLIFYGLTLIFPALALVAVVVWDKLSPPASFGGFLFFSVAATVLFIASFVPVLVVFMRLMVAIPVLALEGLAGWAACRRSSTLVRYDPGLGFFYWGELRLSMLLLPLFVIQLLVYTLTSVPLIMAQINEVVRHGTATQLSGQADAVVVGSQILTFVSGALIVPLYAIAVALFYYDVRIRREGFDLEFLAARLERAS